MSLLSRLPLTVHHAYDFGAARDLVGDSLLDPEAWDIVRRQPGPFELPSDRGAWEQAASTPERVQRAQTIISILHALGGRRLVSYGVGAAMLELVISSVDPSVEIVCTEYAPRTLERLGTLFPEAEIVAHDLRHDAPLRADLHLLHRVDSELDDTALARLYGAFRQPVIVAVTELLSLSTLARELRVRLTRRRPTAAGWVRSEARFRRLWRPHEVTRITFDESPLFLLRPTARTLGYPGRA